MFWWFKRGDQMLRYESRQIAPGAYELTVRMPDGKEQVERFTDQAALADREIALKSELTGEGWTGPHGWNI